MKKSTFKMNGWSGYQTSPIKQKSLNRAPDDFDWKAAKTRAKEAFKRDAAKTGHGTIEDLKAKSKHWKSFEKFQSQTKKAQEWKKDIMKQVKVSKPTSKLDKAKKILSTNLKSAGKILRKRFLKF